MTVKPTKCAEILSVQITTGRLPLLYFPAEKCYYHSSTEYQCNDRHFYTVLVLLPLVEMKIYVTA